MTPPALAERVEPAVDLIDSIRSALTEKEQAQFEMDLMESRHGGRDSLRDTLNAWALSVLVRSHESYQSQVQGLLEFIRKEESEPPQ